MPFEPVTRSVTVVGLLVSATPIYRAVQYYYAAPSINAGDIDDQHLFTVRRTDSGVVFP
jgi:hypothetical protein